MTERYKPKNGPATLPDKFDYSLFVARETKSKTRKKAFNEAEEKLKGVELENDFSHNKELLESDIEFTAGKYNKES